MWRRHSLSELPARRSLVTRNVQRALADSEQSIRLTREVDSPSRPILDEQDYGVHTS